MAPTEQLHSRKRQRACLVQHGIGFSQGGALRGDVSVMEAPAGTAAEAAGAPTAILGKAGPLWLGGGACGKKPLIKTLTSSQLPVCQAAQKRRACGGTPPPAPQLQAAAAQLAPECGMGPLQAVVHSDAQQRGLHWNPAGQGRGRAAQGCKLLHVPAARAAHRWRHQPPTAGAAWLSQTYRCHRPAWCAKRQERTAACGQAAGACWVGQAACAAQHV